MNGMSLLSRPPPEEVPPSAEPKGAIFSNKVIQISTLFELGRAGPESGGAPTFYLPAKVVQKNFNDLGWEAPRKSLL